MSILVSWHNINSGKSIREKQFGKINAGIQGYTIKRFENIQALRAKGLHIPELNTRARFALVVKGGAMNSPTSCVLSYSKTGTCVMENEYFYTEV